MTTGHTRLSLDLGLTTGYCRMVDEVIVASGVAVFSRKDDTHPGARFVRFYNFLVENKDVAEICFEMVGGFKGAKAAVNYGGFLAVLQMFCKMRKIRMTGIKPKTVKKEFAGNGNADKTAMCRTAHRLGWTHGHPETDMDHDECDAIAIAFVTLKRYGLEPRLLCQK